LFHFFRGLIRSRAASSPSRRRIGALMIGYRGMIFSQCRTPHSSSFIAFRHNAPLKISAALALRETLALRYLRFRHASPHKRYSHAVSFRLPPHSNAIISILIFSTLLNGRHFKERSFVMMILYQMDCPSRRRATYATRHSKCHLSRRSRHFH